MTYGIYRLLIENMVLTTAYHARRHGSMKGRSLVDFAIQNVVKFQASKFCGGITHLLVDDK